MVNIETRFELEKTAAFYGYYIKYNSLQNNMYSLYETGSNEWIARFSGQEALGQIINWCNWFFAEIDQLEREREEWLKN